MIFLNRFRHNVLKIEMILIRITVFINTALITFKIPKYPFSISVNKHFFLESEQRRGHHSEVSVKPLKLSSDTWEKMTAVGKQEKPHKWFLLCVCHKQRSLWPWLLGLTTEAGLLTDLCVNIWIFIGHYSSTGDYIEYWPADIYIPPVNRTQCLLSCIWRLGLDTWYQISCYKRAHTFCKLLQCCYWRVSLHKLLLCKFDKDKKWFSWGNEVNH